MMFLLLAVLGVLGWRIMKALKAPSPALLGPMLLVGVLQIKGIDFPDMPNIFISAFQLILGTFVGIRINREQLKLLKNKTVLYSAILILAWTVGTTILAANTLLTFTDLDIATSLLSGSPGGMTEMSIVAFAYGADVPTVALLQLLRLTLIVSFIPFLTLGIVKRNGGSYCKKAVECTNASDVPNKGVPYEILTMGIIMGSLFIYLGMPAGGLIGAIIGVGTGNIITNKCLTLSKNYLLLAQIGIGISIGLSFTKETVEQFSNLLVPVIILPLFMVVSGIILAFVMRVMTKWDISTCLLSSAPAGLSQMIIVAEDIDSDVFMVSFFQTTRLLTIYLVLPHIFNWYLM